jgi:hypothetical protein
MYYTKLVLEDHVEMTLNDAFLLIIEERWKLMSDGNGRTKYYMVEGAESWTLNETYDSMTVEESKQNWDAKVQGEQSAFSPSVTRHACIKVWNTESAAQAWVAAVEALDLPGVTISYHGTTDPTV